ncbi:carbon-nitrogen hydrolase family protein [uncultured Gimesia sp.]|uniref:carbon-nitrogen hydrolase family protein n=1 Tax=uncultured Gimesia sp. TaxID=1678688 RepID=UPI0030DAAF27|tara:strand:- start:16285 stop:17088 length:804 start_codon:yes stop_codon:yes gene_type:complete
MAQFRSIAVAQTCPVAGDVEANLDEHVQLARLAAAEKAKVVVFPELSLLGYELGRAGELAFSNNDGRLDSLLDVAESLAITLIVGASIRLGKSLYIGAFILLPDRTTELYTKHHLGAFPPSAECDSLDGSIPSAEATVFQPGNLNPLIRLHDHKAALAICADIGTPSHAEIAAERGADSYLASMFVIPSEFDGDAAKLRKYASQHRMMTALANFGRPSGGLRSAGRSSIWSEEGELLVQLDAKGSGVAVVIETPDGRHAQSIMLNGN